MKHKTPPRIELPATPETDAAFALRHTKTCTIAHFRQVMEKMERERDAAVQALDNATRGKGAAVPKIVADPIDECNKEQADPSWANSPIHKEIQEWEQESIHSQHVNKPDVAAD
jgi:hypothetical protein